MTRPELTHPQRVVLCGMLAEREGERHRLRAWALSHPEDWFDQNRWELLGREMTLLRVLLGEYKKVPQWAEPISDAEKRSFWQHCQTQFGKESVKARTTAALSSRPKQEPRTDTSLAYGD